MEKLLCVKMNDLFFRKIENLYNIVLDDLNKGYDVR